MNFQAGKISAEEAIDKSKIPGAMVDRMQRAGIMIGKVDDALMAEAADAGGGAPGAPAPGAAGGDDKNAQAAAARARMQALAGKK